MSEYGYNRNYNDNSLILSFFGIVINTMIILISIGILSLLYFTPLGLIICAAILQGVPIVICVTLAYILLRNIIG